MKHRHHACSRLQTLARVAMVGAVLFAGGPADAQGPSDWTMYNYDVAGSRFNRAETTLSAANVPQLVEKWRFPTADYLEPVGVIHATPTVVDGYVYFGTATHPSFYKLSPSGKLCWEFKMDKKAWGERRRALGSRLVPANGVYNSALVTAKAVFFGDCRGRFYSLNRANGKLNWQIDATDDETWPGAHAANLFMASPILVDGKLIIAGGAYEHSHPLIPFYRCCRGRGCVAALDPQTGKLLWKYDVGPEPEKFDPPLKLEVGGVERTFHYGPSTSSVWSTPSYDPKARCIYFGTDVHNSPKRPTDEDPRLYTVHSAAIIALNVEDGAEQWICQLNKNDVWNHTIPPYDAKRGEYKDQSIGDTPKLLTITEANQSVPVVAVGCKNGGLYLIHRETGRIVRHTPLYKGPPAADPETELGTLALPSAMGGLQTGCATDGTSIYTNAIDNMLYFPSGGRVTSTRSDLSLENWRHERPKVERVEASDGKEFNNVGDPIGSGIAVANGVAYFTTMVSNQLVALNTSNGKVLREIDLGPVFAGPSVSRGRVYIGTGNTLFSPDPNEGYFRKQSTGSLISFGLPGRDEVDLMGDGREYPVP